MKRLNRIKVTLNGKKIQAFTKVHVQNQLKPQKIYVFFRNFSA